MGESTNDGSPLRGSWIGFRSEMAEEYAQMASDVLRRSQLEGLPTKIAEDGNIRVWDAAANTFGSYTASGGTRTFFKPGDQHVIGALPHSSSTATGQCDRSAEEPRNLGQF